MSLEWMIWALEQDVDAPGMKLVLVILGNYADESGVCWPSQNTLTKKASMSSRAVRDNISRLQSDGFIACRSRTTDLGKYTSNIYQLLGKPRRQILPMDAASIGRNRLRPGADSADGPEADSASNPKEEFNSQGKHFRESNPRVEVSVAAAAAATTSPPTSVAAYIAAVLDLFVEASGRPPRLPSSADRSLAERLYTEGIPLRVVESAILQIFVRNLETAVQQNAPVTSIRSLAYFMSAIRDEQRMGPPRPNYYEFLRFKIRDLKAHLDLPRQGKLG